MGGDLGISTETLCVYVEILHMYKYFNNTPKKARKWRHIFRKVLWQETYRT
jgi:hypothetical protein